MCIYEDLKAWGDCGDAAHAYRAYNITSHAQAWNMLIASDKHEWLLWLALYTPAVPRESVKAFLDVTVERAIKRAMELHTVPTFDAWATKWLSSEDRTADAARATRAKMCGEAQTAWAVADAAVLIASWRMSESWAAAIAAVAASCTAGRSAAMAAREAGASWQRAAATQAAEIRQQADWWRTQPNPFK